MFNIPYDMPDSIPSKEIRREQRTGWTLLGTARPPLPTWTAAPDKANAWTHKPQKQALLRVATFYVILSNKATV